MNKQNNYTLNEIDLKFQNLHAQISFSNERQEDHHQQIKRLLDDIKEMAIQQNLHIKKNNEFRIRSETTVTNAKLIIGFIGLSNVGIILKIFL